MMRSVERVHAARVRAAVWRVFEQHWLAREKAMLRRNVSCRRLMNLWPTRSVLSTLLRAWSEITFACGACASIPASPGRAVDELFRSVAMVPTWRLGWPVERGNWWCLGCCGWRRRRRHAALLTELMWMWARVSVQSQRVGSCGGCAGVVGSAEVFVGYSASDGVDGGGGVAGGDACVDGSCSGSSQGVVGRRWRCVGGTVAPLAVADARPGEDVDVALLERVEMVCRHQQVWEVLVGWGFFEDLRLLQAWRHGLRRRVELLRTRRSLTVWHRLAGGGPPPLVDSSPDEAPPLRAETSQSSSYEGVLSLGGISSSEELWRPLAGMLSVAASSSDEAPPLAEASQWS